MVEAGDYILTIPDHPAYKDLIWKFLDGKKFQIHRCMSDADNIILVTTLYFPPIDMQQYFLDHITEKQRWDIGLMTFTNRIKKPKRPCKRIEQSQTLAV